MHVTYHGNITKPGKTIGWLRQTSIGYHWQAHISYQLTTGTITRLIKEGYALTKNQAHNRINKATRNYRNKASSATNEIDL